LHNEQMVNRLRKITWASIFRFPFETAACTHTHHAHTPPHPHTTHTPPHTHIHTENGTNRIQNKRKTELMENGTNGKRNFHLFAANRNDEHPFVC
jgi:hypothetical protein